jgi:hypothetical protein
MLSLFDYLFKILSLLRNIAAEQIAQRALLQRILDRVGADPVSAVQVVFNAVLEGHFFLRVESMIIKATQEFDASVMFLDSLGNPAPIDGRPAWLNNNDTVLSMVVSEDGMTAVISATGIPGSGQISVNADADLGEGVVPITGTLDVEVVPGDAVNVTLNSGPIRDRTPVEPEVPPIE